MSSRILNCYVPALDGIRAVSIALVFFAHFGFAGVPGIFGVTIFFFVSGYLITGQLLAELTNRDTIGLVRFYIRRGLRLFPALFVMVAVSAVLFPMIGLRVTAADVLGALSYLTNYWPLLVGNFDTGTAHAPHPFGVLWSLAVEEQYYLVFPVLCLAFGRSRLGFAALIAGLIVLVTAWRLHVTSACSDGHCPLNWVWHASDTRIDSILYGALFATLLASPLRRRTLAAIGNLPAFAIGMALLLGSLSIRNPWFRDTWRFSVQGVGLFLTIGALLFGARLDMVRRWLSVRPLLLLGRLSYSLYLWHWVVKCLAGTLLPDVLWMPVMQPRIIPPAWWLTTVFVPAAAASLMLAAASYYGIERPMVQLRRRFGSHAVADSAEPTAHRTVAVSGTPGW